MSDYNLAQKPKPSEASAIGRSLPISVKHAVNICAAIRGKKVSFVRTYLQNVMILKQAIPYKRYYHNVGHRIGIGPGRFPVKASEEILALVTSAEKNAINKGLSASNLVVTHVCAQMGGKRQKTGGRSAKRAHIEVIVGEGTA